MTPATPSASSADTAATTATLEEIADGVLACLPFNVKRVVDELDGREPVIWTAESDARIRAELQG